MKDVLPDSRLREPKGVVRGPHPLTTRLNWVPIFCANCGADGGYVPEEYCTFSFYLCNPCAETYGKIEGTYMEPDDEFWERVNNKRR